MLGNMCIFIHEHIHTKKVFLYLLTDDMCLVKGMGKEIYFTRRTNLR